MRRVPPGGSRSARFGWKMVVPAIERVPGSGVQARPAAIALTVMFAAFTPLVHIPLLLADPSGFTTWTENALNLALTGAAWVVADSLARPGRRPRALTIRPSEGRARG